MATTRATYRLQLIVLLAVVVAGAAALLWSRTIAGDGADVIRLDEPGEYVDPAVSNPTNQGERVPDVELTTPAGAVTRLAGDGRPMVVNLWYSTCPPCARELTYFAGVDDELDGAVRFVGVNSFDDAATMRQFAAARGVDYELLLDPDGNLGDALGVVQYPVTLFVDADGEIVAQTGALSEAKLREHAPELLA